MWLFKRKINTDPMDQQTIEDNNVISFEESLLRHNNITRLSIDERWTKLFVSIKMNEQIEQAERDMNELIKKEAMLKNEQENLEPQKRKLMKEIMNLTQEAFENDNKQAKERLKNCKKEIERINSRINDVLEDIESLNAELRKANLKLLNDSTWYIFTTLKENRDRAQEIKNELNELEQRKTTLTEELENISVDWTKYAVDLTELLGTDEVKRLEEEFGLEELKDEIINTKTDENN